MFDNFDAVSKEVEAKLADTSAMDNFDEEKFWNEKADSIQSMINHRDCGTLGIHWLTLSMLLGSIVLLVICI